jgi:hemoglobin-like flavoprotein
MLTPDRERLVRESWRVVEADPGPAARFFYEKLFELDPHARSLFAHVDMRTQERKLSDMLSEIVRLLDDPARFVADLASLGRRHVAYGARDGDYDSVGAALVWTIEQQLGGDFTPEIGDAWAEAYRAMAGVMRRAAARTTAEHAVPPAS